MPSADTTLVLLSVKSLRGVSICRRLVGETLNTNVRFFSNLSFLLIAIEGLVDVRFLLKEDEFLEDLLEEFLEELLEEFLEEPDVAEIFRYVIRSFHCSTKHLPH